MKKITIPLYIATLLFTSIKSMEQMDVEEYSNQNLNNTSESSSTINTKSSSSNPIEKLLKQNNALLKDLITLTRASVLQQKIHFEYEDDKKYTTDRTINQHAQDTKKSLDNLYTSTNAQLNNKALQIPMTGKTEIAKTTKNKDTEGII